MARSSCRPSTSRGGPRPKTRPSPRGPRTRPRSRCGARARGRSATAPRRPSGVSRFGFGFIEVGPYALGSDNHWPILRAPLIAGMEPHRLGARLRSRPPHTSVWLRLALGEGGPGSILNIERLLESVDGAIDVVCISILQPEAGTSGDSDVRGTWRRLLGVCREQGISTVLVDYPRSGLLSAIQPALDAGAGGLVIRTSAEPMDAVDVWATVRQARAAMASPGLVVVAGGARSPRDVVEAF